MYFTGSGYLMPPPLVAWDALTRGCLCVRNPLKLWLPGAHEVCCAWVSFFWLQDATVSCAECQTSKGMCAHVLPRAEGLLLGMQWWQLLYQAGLGCKFVRLPIVSLLMCLIDGSLQQCLAAVLCCETALMKQQGCPCGSKQAIACSTTT